MINGLFISEKGDVQILGNVQSGELLLKALYALLPQLEQQENERLARTYSKEKLQELIALQDTLEQ